MQRFDTGISTMTFFCKSVFRGFEVHFNGDKIWLLKIQKSPFLKHGSIMKKNLHNYKTTTMHGTKCIKKAKKNSK